MAPVIKEPKFLEFSVAFVHGPGPLININNCIYFLVKTID